MNIQVIEKSIDDAIRKCSNDTIRQRLSELSDYEIYDKLESVANPFELADYLAKKRTLDYWKSNGSYNPNGDNEKSFQKDIFDYEKRIYRGYDLNKNMDNVPSYSLNDFSKDNDTRNPSKQIEDLGNLEKQQIDSQKDISLTNDEALGLMSYFSTNSLQINSMLDHNYGRPSNYSEMSAYDLMPQEVKDELPIKYENTVNNIDSAINKTVGLLQPTVLYTGVQHSNIVDIHTRVGDKIKMPSYISASYQEHIGENYGRELKGDTGGASKLYVKFLAPKGTKGFCANDTNHSVEIDGKATDNVHLSGYLAEHEYLLGRGQSGTVVNIDYELGEVTILLDGT